MASMKSSMLNAGGSMVAFAGLTTRTARVARIANVRLLTETGDGGIRSRRTCVFARDHESSLLVSANRRWIWALVRFETTGIRLANSGSAHRVLQSSPAGTSSRIRSIYAKRRRSASSRSEIRQYVSTPYKCPRL